MSLSFEKTARSIRELGLPTLLSQAFMSLTLSRGPWIWPITVPCLVFFTQPLSPRLRPWSSVYILKQTPCTFPKISKSTEVSLFSDMTALKRQNQSRGRNMSVHLKLCTGLFLALRFDTTVTNRPLIYPQQFPVMPFKIKASQLKWQHEKDFICMSESNVTHNPQQKVCTQLVSTLLGTHVLSTTVLLWGQKSLLDMWQTSGLTDFKWPLQT